MSESDAASRSSRAVRDPAVLQDFNARIVEQFRKNGGELTKGPLAGAPIVVLTMTGAKSGRQLEVPVAYSRDGDRLVVVASKAGAPTNPAWYFNLKANPDVTVEVGTEKYAARATEATGDERDRLYDAMAKVMPVFKEYAAKAKRTIPVFVIERAG